ncbi:UDP-3-O-(3-hydroxymyristoyl)glucosamine N-acyltransferase [Gammaproteobacteria bacterium]|nr:UDP-3-O-(3-hydroxymyristoyl)glucosamine N-acyltransferase [Gammaproteobacteria bacterium]
MSKKSFKLSEIADFLGGQLVGDGSKNVSELKTLFEADKGSISFIYNKKFKKDLETTSAAVVLISEEYIKHCHVDYILVANPHESYAKLTQLFSGNLRNKKLNENYADSYSKEDIEIGSNVYIGKNVIIEKGTKINPGAFIGDDVFIGEDTYLHPNVCLYHSVKIGRKNIIHANSVIGSDGLGFAKAEDSWEKIEHLGSVELKDDVEVGASCTIDRASLGTTVLNCGVKLDNQVHIAHNCNIGKNTIIGAKTAIAGSTVIGEDCLIGGGCGIVDNLKIENGVRINPMSFVTKSIKKSGIYSGGSVVLEHSKWLKHITIQKKEFDD